MMEQQYPIRIAQMMTDMNYGGVEMVIMNYYRHIDKTKYQFDFYVFKGSEVPQRQEIEKMGGHIYIVPKYTNLFGYINTVSKAMKQHRYKIIHSNMNALSVFSLFVAKREGVNIRISHNHSTAAPGETKKNIVKTILRCFSKLYATNLFACSTLAGNWLYGSNSFFEVINNAIDVSIYRYNNEVRLGMRKKFQLEDNFVIGHIGRFCFQKNHDKLIDIFSEIIHYKDNAVLLLIGDGELKKEMELKVLHLGIQDKVIFLEKRSDVQLLYQMMDVFVLPSHYEGLPVVAVEAQASGLPCVLSDAVTTDAKILDTTSFININESNRIWVSEILKYEKGFLRHDTSDKMREKGFDIRDQAIKLMKKYDNMLERKNIKTE